VCVYLERNSVWDQGFLALSLELVWVFWCFFCFRRNQSSWFATIICFSGNTGGRNGSVLILNKNGDRFALACSGWVAKITFLEDYIMGWNKPGYIRKQRLKRAKREMIRIIIKLQSESCCNEPGACQAEKGEACNGGVCSTETQTH
jgi:hypothetical protein